MSVWKEIEAREAAWRAANPGKSSSRPPDPPPRYVAPPPPELPGMLAGESGNEGELAIILLGKLEWQGGGDYPGCPCCRTHTLDDEADQRRRLPDRLSRGARSYAIRDVVDGSVREEGREAGRHRVAGWEGGMITDTRNRVEDIPGVAATIRRKGSKLYLSAGGSKSALDEVEALIRRDWPKAYRTSGSYGLSDFDVTWRVNP